MHIKEQSKSKIRISWLSAEPGFHPHHLPSALPGPENQNNPIPGVQVAGHGLSNFLAANYTLCKSFSLSSLKILTTVCFKHCSWSRSLVRFG